MLVLDTNILIGYLAGDAAVTAFLDAAREREERLAVSVITEIELLASPALQPGDEILIERLVASLDVIGLYDPLARGAARLRRQYRMPLGDAVIAATAQSRMATLVTRDRALQERAAAAGIAVASIP